MLRAVNLIVEVFVDVTRDGGGSAEALLLHNADRCLLARGFARVPAAKGGADSPDELSVAAAALKDLVDALTVVPGGSALSAYRTPVARGPARPGPRVVADPRPPVRARPAVAS